MNVGERRQALNTQAYQHVLRALFVSTGGDAKSMMTLMKLRKELDISSEQHKGWLEELKAAKQAGTLETILRQGPSAAGGGASSKQAAPASGYVLPSQQQKQQQQQQQQQRQQQRQQQQQQPQRGSVSQTPTQQQPIHSRHQPAQTQHHVRTGQPHTQPAVQQQQQRQQQQQQSHPQQRQPPQQQQQSTQKAGAPGTGQRRQSSSTAGAAGAPGAAAGTAPKSGTKSKPSSSKKKKKKVLSSDDEDMAAAQSDSQDDLVIDSDDGGVGNSYGRANQNGRHTGSMQGRDGQGRPTPTHSQAGAGGRAGMHTPGSTAGGPTPRSSQPKQKSQTVSLSDLPQLIGYQVQRYWPNEGKWYLGVVTDWREKDGQYCITYNLGKKDESMEWFDIQKAEQIGNPQLSYYQKTEERIDLRRHANTRAFQNSSVLNPTKGKKKSGGGGGSSSVQRKRPLAAM